MPITLAATLVCDGCGGVSPAELIVHGYQDMELKTPDDWETVTGGETTVWCPGCREKKMAGAVKPDSED